MDTRNKIVDAAGGARVCRQLRESGKQVRLVTGYFDPLLLKHASRLKEMAEDGAALAVVITNPARPLLPERSRAELVAGLEAVNCVVLAPGTAADVLIAELSPDFVCREEQIHERWASELAGNVHARHVSGGTA